MLNEHNQGKALMLATEIMLETEFPLLLGHFEDENGCLPTKVSTLKSLQEDCGKTGHKWSEESGLKSCEQCFLEMTS